MFLYIIQRKITEMLLQIKRIFSVKWHDIIFLALFFCKQIKTKKLTGHPLFF